MFFYQKGENLRKDKTNFKTNGQFSNVFGEKKKEQGIYIFDITNFFLLHKHQ